MDDTGASQQALADYVGVTRQAVAQWKDGKTIPDMYNFKRIAEFFKIPYEYLLGDTDSKAHENMALADIWITCYCFFRICAKITKKHKPGA